LNESFSYAQDPSASKKIGFGYSVSSSHTNEGSINFVKGEIMNLQTNQKIDKNSLTKQQKSPIENCDIKKGIIKILVKLHFVVYFKSLIIFSLGKTIIEDLSLLISSKLHYLSDCENNEKLSSVQVMTIKIDVS